MVKVIFDKITCGETDKNTTVVAYSNTFVFCIVKIGGKDTVVTYSKALVFRIVKIGGKDNQYVQLI